MKPNSTKSRRGFLKDLCWLGAAAAAVRSAEGSPVPPPGPARLPGIKLGSLEVSRLILGSNPFWGFSHGNPQASAAEMRDFNTDERILATLDAAAAQGITAVWSPCYPRWIRLWDQYRARGGGLKTWIAQPDPKPEKMEEHIRLAAQHGAGAVCIQGIRVDEQMAQEKFDVLRGWLELIKSLGMPAGMATHRARTHLVAEEKGLPADFHHQTMYRPDTYVREGWIESLQTIRQLTKPVVAYKVLAAGRHRPADVLPELLRSLKPKDGVCLGMFPRKHDEVSENASLLHRLSDRVAARDRGGVHSAVTSG